MDLFRSLESETQKLHLDKLEKSLGEIRRGVFARLNGQEKNILEIENVIKDFQKRLEYIEESLSLKVNIG